MGDSRDTATPGQTINQMPTGVFVTLVKVRRAGAIQARRSSLGEVTLYWRYSIGSYSERVRIGLYDSSAPPKSLEPTSRGYSVAAAVAMAEGLAKEHDDKRKDGGRPALIKEQAEAKAKEEQKRRQVELKRRQAAEAKAKKAEMSKLFSLKNLLIDYCDHLKALDRPSHTDARSIFNKHAIEAWPEVAALPANTVTVEQIADMMRRTLEQGKGRTANKLRSYIRAAYQTAKASRSKPSIPLKFKDYNVIVNPAADTEPEQTANKADKRPLSPDEMRLYWQIIKDAPGFKGAVLRLHLLTGAQRIQQLVNLKTADIGDDTITLYDGKGRPGAAPRPHTIPLTSQAAAALKQCKPTGEYALSTDGGSSHLGAMNLSRWSVNAVGDAIPEFQAKRLRSGVETMLAGERISSEIRGRLQSHGIAGVQARHYDGHDYMAEKLEALKALHRALQPVKPGKVVQLRKA